MQEKKIKKLNEIFYTTKLDNGFEIILYPTTKSKNFYITLTTKFGASTLFYEENKEEVEVIPGTAHFLEHKVLDVNDKEILSEIEKLGSSVNAYTNYYGTTYNIYGSKEILKNIEILFKRVFTFNLTDQSVNNEKSIINEEIDMVYDRPGTVLYRQSNLNLFHHDYLIHHVLGTKDSISKITKEYLYKIYDTFYTPNNMFCVITGNFDKDIVNEYITELANELKENKNEVNIKKIDEPYNVKVDYEEKEMNVVYDKISISYKMNIKDFKKINIKQIKAYINLYLTAIFDSTTEFYNNCVKDDIIIGGIDAYDTICNDYLVIHIMISNSKNTQEFLKRFEEYIKGVKVSEETFNRKKKVYLSGYILSFEDIESVNDSLTFQTEFYNYISTNSYEEIKNLNFKEFNEIINNIDYENKSIVILHK